MESILQGILELKKNQFEALREFYKIKNSLGFGVFSCYAAEQFPNGWLEACKSGKWPEKGIYGDNFRQAFELTN